MTTQCAKGPNLLSRLILPIGLGAAAFIAWMGYLAYQQVVVLPRLEAEASAALHATLIEDYVSSAHGADAQEETALRRVTGISFQIVAAPPYTVEGRKLVQIQGVSHDLCRALLRSLPRNTTMIVANGRPSALRDDNACLEDMRTRSHKIHRNTMTYVLAP